jgi:two-component system, OmpR family, sensor histidine kinase SenX3
MLVVVVFAMIGALMIGILIGRRTGIVALRSLAGTAPHQIEHHGVVPGKDRAELVLASPPAEPGLVCGVRPEDPAPDKSDAARLDDEVRGDFVANVSHELKTPVGAVALLAEAVLEAAEEPQEVRRFTTKILNEANRLGALVTELIVLSRPQSAERLPELATVEVDEVVHEALDRCRLAAESANIRITVDAPSGLLVKGDATLATALSNLLANAVAYSPSGSTVSVSRQLVNGLVEIAVTDRGLGIALEHQQRVFERFFRVDQARSRSTGGTGLGLAIVKHVAANHGGNVHLWSKPGTGSTFTLRIPACPDHSQHRSPTASILQCVGGT